MDDAFWEFILKEKYLRCHKEAVFFFIFNNSKYFWGSFYASFWGKANIKNVDEPVEGSSASSACFLV
jgi:hypothetical protein